MEQVQFFREKEEIKNGVTIYEIEFYDQDFEYEYKINASDGTIIEADKENKRKF